MTLTSSLKRPLHIELLNVSIFKFLEIMIILPLPIRFPAICFAAIVVINLQTSMANNPVCNTAECKELAHLYTSNMNLHVNPCKNFYEFACSGFQERHKDTLLYSYWGIEDEMKQKIDQDLKKLLDSPAQSRDVKFEQAKAVYKACAYTGHITRTNMPTLLGMAMNKISWPILRLKQRKPSLGAPCWATDKHYIKLAGYSAFYGFKIVADENNPNRIITVLTKPISPYGMIVRTADWEDSELFNYKSLLHRLIRMVASNNNTPTEEALDEDLNELIIFRDNMRKIIEGSPSKNEVPLKIKIEQFQHWYDLQLNSKRTAEINWLEVIRAMYKIPDNRYAPTITAASEIIVRRNYFTKLASLLGRTKTRVLENHIHVYFVERSLEFDAQMKAQLRETFNDEKATGRFILEVPRWRKCIENSNMKEVLQEMYVKEYFSKDKETDVIRIIQESKRLLSEQISHSNWLNYKTKMDSKRKIITMRNVVGYSRLNEPNEVQPLSVDIYYEPPLNRISVSAGNLQLPIYGKSLPYCISFGATMSSFGHELYHAYDPEGLEFDQHGNVPWWAQDMLTEYNKQLQCFKHHYDGFKKVEFRKYGGTYNSHLPSTINEDYADAMGLKLAYDGFKEKLQDSKGACQTLPGFENFSCHKLFFLAFANTYCTYATPGIKAKYMKKETHSLPEVRVNAAVANIDDFSAVFGCKLNDPLNPQERCDIWQR